MTRRTDLLHAPKMGWKQIVYPIIVIPWIFNAGLQVPAYTSLKSGFMGESAVPAPRFVAPARRDREDAFRGKLLDQKDYPQVWHSGRGAAPINAAQFKGGDVHAEAQQHRSAQRSSPEHVVKGAAHPHNAVAAPVQGVTRDGRAYVWERNPKYPVIEFVMILTNERR
jgi:hypothetical protein